MPDNPTVFYHWPNGRRLHCRPCERLTVHNVDEDDARYVTCENCRTMVLGAQVVSLYSDDKYERVPRIHLPKELRSEQEMDDIRARIYHWQPQLGVLGTYVPEDNDQWDGLDGILAELGGA